MSVSLVFRPLNRPLRGQVRVPGDKSISQRAIFLACMAQGVSHIYDAAYSSDVMSAIEVMRKLGAKIRITHSKYSNSQNMDLEIRGWGDDGPKPSGDILYCGNSATCARVSMGILAPFDVEAIFDGDDSLHHRPFMRVIDPLLQMGANFKVLARNNGKPQRSTLPCKIEGCGYATPINYDMPVASSQVKAAILFAGVNTEGQTTITEPYPSRTHTELLLKKFGADVSWDTDLLSCSIYGPARLHACDIHIPGDTSSAAYFATAASLVSGSKIELTDICLNEGRMGFVRALKRMGARISIEQKTYGGDIDYGYEKVGNITVEYGGRLHGIDVPEDEIPSLIDEVPILSLAAACSEGSTTFYSVKELKLKECNRIQAIASGLRKLGTDARDDGNNLHITGGIDIEGKTSINPVEQDIIDMDNFGDHRLGICWALAGICGYKATRMTNFEVTKVSYPNILEDFRKVMDYQ